MPPAAATGGVGVGLLLLVGALGVAVVAVGVEAGGGEADGGDCWLSRSAAKGEESACWPAAVCCVCGGEASGTAAVTSGEILGILGTATPRELQAKHRLQPAGHPGARRNPRKSKALSATDGGRRRRLTAAARQILPRRMVAPALAAGLQRHGGATV